MYKLLITKCYTKKKKKLSDYFENIFRSPLCIKLLYYLVIIDDKSYY